MAIHAVQRRAVQGSTAGAPVLPPTDVWDARPVGALPQFGVAPPSPAPPRAAQSLEELRRVAHLAPEAFASSTAPWQPEDFASACLTLYQSGQQLAAQGAATAAADEFLRVAQLSQKAAPHAGQAPEVCTALAHYNRDATHAAALMHAVAPYMAPSMAHAPPPVPAADAHLPAAVRACVQRQLNCLAQADARSPEAAAAQRYVDLCRALPWAKRRTEQLDLVQARRSLDAQHRGMEPIKQRILDDMAVRSLTGQPQGQVLCLAGPPGVGKTSIVRAWAAALGVPLVTKSLGGVHDEAQVRGFPRTYAGALPGALIAAMAEAECSNPLVLLDEIDKLGHGQGDPAAALLEVLDPVQNKSFRDHFLELDYDLSQVLFVCTANDLQAISEPLLNRLKVVHLPGYTEDEKVDIARAHLLPACAAATGVGGRIAVTWTDAALRHVIRGYTQEAGVRSLRGQLDDAYSRLAGRLVQAGGSAAALTLTPAAVEGLLGAPPLPLATEALRGGVGCAHALAVHAQGGRLLNVQVRGVPGTGQLITTGCQGQVMREAAQVAHTYLKTNPLHAAQMLAVDTHVHIMDADLPKDGPSAGVTLVTAMVSACSQRPVRADVAMTGEIDLQGNIRPVSGLAQKVLAAARAGVKLLLVPSGCGAALAALAPEQRGQMDIVAVDHCDAVLQLALG